MTELNHLLSRHISCQINSWSPISSESTIGNVLDEIKKGKHKESVEDLRHRLKMGDKDYYDSYKKRLPAVTFSATFKQRRVSTDLKKYNSLTVIDIDALTDEQIQETYSILLNDRYVFAFWRSPSNNGFKGLVSINYGDENIEGNFVSYHKRAFKKIVKYFSESYKLEIDNSGSDLTRLCFLSFDESLIVKSQYHSIDVEKSDLIEVQDKPITKKQKIIFASDRDVFYSPVEKNISSDRKIMSNIIRYLTNKGLSITFNYLDWYKTAMAIANSFTYDVGVNYFLKLSAMDKEKFNELECRNFLMSCFEARHGKITFSSIVYLANKKGFKTKFQRNGVPKAGG